mmetsp:Transcript_22272/g.50445  ORF Transcript_22272/g.50445 Transcript_22272/m.50445 type:complete len:176 (+) Transcript_22272:1-528(+)
MVWGLRDESATTPQTLTNFLWVLKELQHQPDLELIEVLRGKVEETSHQFKLDEISSCVWSIGGLNVAGAPFQVVAIHEQVLADALRQGEEAVLRQPGMPHEHFASIISAISKHDRTGILPALLFKMTPKAASNSLSGHQKTPPDDDLSRLRFRGILSTLGSQHHKTEAFSPGCLE